VKKLPGSFFEKKDNSKLLKLMSNKHTFDCGGREVIIIYERSDVYGG
jgi:hypothetical protein